MRADWLCFAARSIGGVMAAALLVGGAPQAAIWLYLGVEAGVWAAWRTFGGGSAMIRVLGPAAMALGDVAVFVGFLGGGWAPVWAVCAIFAGELGAAYARTLGRQLGGDVDRPLVRASKRAVYLAASALAGFGLAPPGAAAWLFGLAGAASLVAFADLLRAALAVGRAAH